MIRDVSASYRRAIRATVEHFSGWCPEIGAIDALKAEGRWNNDWEASRELLRRHLCQACGSPAPLPSLAEVTEVFGGFYFGGDPEGPPTQWQGYIRQEPLLVEGDFFGALDRAGVVWGFVSGAEPPSAQDEACGHDPLRCLRGEHTSEGSSRGSASQSS